MYIYIYVYIYICIYIYMLTRYVYHIYVYKYIYIYIYIYTHTHTHTHTYTCIYDIYRMKTYLENFFIWTQIWRQRAAIWTKKCIVIALIKLKIRCWWDDLPASRREFSTKLWAKLACKFSSEFSSACNLPASCRQVAGKLQASCRHY
jgi:hypothetical protein